MSKYTTQLRHYIESHSQDNTSVSSVRDKIEIGRVKLFDFDYPIFNSLYKKDFETHFIRKFYTREIGVDTIGLFKFNLETWLLVNMPYYNKMFESELIDFDPLMNSKVDSNYTKTKDKTDTETKIGTVTNVSSVDETVSEDNFDRQLESNTPDSRLTITSNDGQGVIEYASQINENNENNTQNSSSDSTNTETNNLTNTNVIDDTETFVNHKEGKIGVQSFSKMLTEYRDTFMRIENKMFEEMQELFMLVY